MTDNFRGIFLREAAAEFRKVKKLADRAIEQVDDDSLGYTIDPETNCIAITMHHLAGNMLSRWTDFLTTDGEKPNRNRDREFEIGPKESRAAILNEWEAGWACTFHAIDSLRPEDLERTVTIRGAPLTIPGAINRQLTHYGYHVGQIVTLVKHILGPRWRTLSIARGESAQHNAHSREPKR